ncbi:unnamed protein product [Protopolystoma xenopodis]|uniref:Cadherin domain-containing protein n=1 Tax=Protopolystoma xenopodis TaxID=117903 RepID=A0A3S5FCJ4_9PLAT|nr:unnamed protein product [Protopolystoma xenopodis]
MCLHQKATSGFADLSKWPICLCAALTKPTKSGLHSLGHVFARLIGLVTWSISASWPATYPSTSHVPRPATVLVVTMAVTVAATAASASASSSGSRSGAGSGNATSGGATSSAGGNSRGGASSAAGAARTAAITVQQLNYTIDENTATGSVVGRLAEDMYPRPLAEARFSMPENAFFQVSLSGVFTVAGPIDRDGNRQLCVQPGYPAVCQWNGLIMSSTGQYIPVEVAVHDVNDNPPSWPIDDVTLDVPENSPASYTAELPLATDADFGINSVKAYRLLDSPATADLFTVTYSQAPTKLHESRNLAATMATSPLPRLHILRSLDRESAAWHNLTLLAFDGSPPFHTGSLHIHVRVTDENDNSPEFSSPVYTARLEEATSVGSLVPLSASPRTGDGTKDGLGFSNRWFSTGGQVNVVGGRGGLHAVDRDDGPNGNVRYSYALSTPIGIQQLFRLDETTGLLRVARELTYGAGANAWTFDVIAEDRGRPPRSSSAKVTIELVDSNNHAPAVALRVLPAGRLPANMSTSALETLGVNDVMGSPDDCVFIMENRPPGNEALAQLTVKDADTGNGGQFDCSLVQPIQTNGLTKFSNSSLTSFIPAQPTYGQKSSSPFSIVSGTSMVRGFGLIELWRLPGLKVYNLMATRSFDREAEVVSKVTVWCMDQGSPRLKSSFHIFVLIGDENDNAPYFQQPRYHLKVCIFRIFAIS